MKRIAVFCGSKPGHAALWSAAAQELGGLLAAEGLGLVYGGGSVGLMGVVADAVLAGGGEVIGVIPQMMDSREIAHPRATQMHVVGTMHERKALMTQLSDAFITLPGGFGTLEELFEVVSWAQLGIHDKPMGLLNVGGFFDSLLTFVDHAIDTGFIKPKYRDLLLVDAEPGPLLHRLRHHRLPTRTVWAKLDES